MTILKTMSKTAIAALVLVGSGLTFAGAQAVQPNGQCHVVSKSTSTETQAVSGGVRHRTVTTTTQRCHGDLSTSTAYSAWR